MMKFQPGQILTTLGAKELPREEVMEGLKRHLRGDWGDISEEDKQANEDALQYGDRLLSAYHTQDGRKYWILTEADRTYTTVLLPEEY